MRAVDGYAAVFLRLAHGPQRRLVEVEQLKS